MKITFLGHAAVLIETGEHNIIIDPFLEGNPQFPKNFVLPKIDYILVSHGHGDHLGDTEKIAKKDGSTVITNYELSNFLAKKGIKVHPMHIGGSFVFPFGKLKLFPALHGSSIIEGEQIIYGGNPCGFVLEHKGKRIYHAGDTGLTMEMELLSDKHIDLAFIPIGGNFVMDIENGFEAVRMFKPKKVVPMHYNTWDIIKADAELFRKKIEELGVECLIMKPGESIEL
ncbi:putative Zn-dependent hydrolase of beta-lactamase fold protein [Fervidobacterium pennivorans DSM 9078]|uniref:UPF0173 metal-dependent hydrolase Ferpe_0719 n=1 Tax=Fervidobacterium pennivorans (strain DSM 9078 / Ven5) TaxID=771875 RepID=H9UBE8_FERPD|nr:metal-dependent hydrolase [Fervidobacterium pennivorans]AFG34841.1 putative Zn-dependent hydrolase of beta-lactamase fold protein [Fervidobacterium pennivorans DSM 9078]